jgi:uncharacterized membrane protein YtjA (UPF0391 family)
MLKRAYISAIIAAVAGIFGFSGLLNEEAAPVAKGICYAFGALSCLSLLFSLFEDSTEQPKLQLAPVEVSPQLMFNFAPEQPALTPIPVKPAPVTPIPVTPIPAYAS